MIIARPLAFGAFVFAVAAAVGCSTSTSNTYGAGGSTGAIQVRDSMLGSGAHPPEFQVSAGGVTKSLPLDGVASFTGLAPGDYSVDISSLGSCTVSGGSAQGTTVFAGYVQYLTFVTTCS